MLAVSGSQLQISFARSLSSFFFQSSSSRINRVQPNRYATRITPQLMPFVESFPTAGLLPKLETKSADFIQQNPTFDGRGTLIAILDTGVDPAAIGLQTTSEGKHKIVDLIDCSGCGDVDLSSKTITVLTRSEDSKVTFKGLSGRTLVLATASSGSRWANPSGIYKLGLKNSLDILPKHSFNRCKDYEKEQFEKDNAKLIALAAAPDSASKDAKEDGVLMGQVLKDMLKNSYQPLGSEFMDVVVWNDGENWRCIVDTAANGGDLSHLSPMTSYAIEHEYARLNVESMTNYSLNFYDDASTVSIVTTSGAHGTHVAMISAGHHPDRPEENGVAPGARIVSLKIGDTRFQGLETSQALIRACTELVRLGVDVCNVSYGEGTVLPSNGKFFDLLKNEVINKAGCVFVTSAGNAGPHLSSVGAPSVVDTSIVVGAYVSHDMMKAYSVPQVKQGSYSWSSLGPAADGDLCVTVYAPGAAVTSVSNSTLDKSELMNGTSMSSPNAAGCVALLLSGLKQKGINSSPYQIKAALRHCGKQIADPFNTPLLQVPKTFSYLVEQASHGNGKVHYNIEIGKENHRGVYLRDAYETSLLHEFKAEVKPFFPRHADPATNVQRIAFEARVALKPSQSWISCPDFAILSTGGKIIAFRVDCKDLKPGFHYARIDAFDTDSSESLAADRAPLFSIPVTICKPEASSDAQLKFVYKLEQAQVTRRFLAVPQTANFAEFTFEWRGSSTAGLVQCNVMQMVPQARYQGFWKEWNFSMLESGVDGELQSVTKKYAVNGGAGMELCLNNFWNKGEAQEITVYVKFHSVLVSSSTGSIHSGFGVGSSGGGELLVAAGLNGFTRFDVSTPLRSESISPKVKFSTLLQTVFSVGQQVKPLGSRDILSNAKHVSQLVLTYNFSLSEVGSEVGFRVPRFADAIYDSQLESLLGAVYDSNKKLLGYFDCYKRTFTFDEPGDYTVLLQLCSSNPSWLDELKGTALVLERNLSKAITPALFKTLECTDAVKQLRMQKGDREVMWMSSAGLDSLPKEAKTGDFLRGTLDVSDTGDQTLYHVYYPLPAPDWKAKPLVPEPEGKKEKKDDSVMVKEAVRDVEVGYLKKHGGDFSVKVAYFNALKEKYPDHLVLYHEALNLYRSEWKKSTPKEVEEESTSDKPAAASSLFLEIGQARIDLAVAVLSLLSQDEVAKYFGTNHDLSQNHEQDTKLQKEMEMKRDLLAGAFQSRGEVYASIRELDPKYKTGAEALKLSQLERDECLRLCQENVDSFKQWAPSDNSALVCLSAWAKFEKGEKGSAMSLLEKHLQSLIKKDSDKAKQAKKECAELKSAFIVKLGWRAWMAYDEKRRLVNHPKDYCRF